MCWLNLSSSINLTDKKMGLSLFFVIKILIICLVMASRFTLIDSINENWYLHKKYPIKRGGRCSVWTKIKKFLDGKIMHTSTCIIKYIDTCININFLCFTDIRIPLMWKDTDHFKNKGGKKNKIQPIFIDCSNTVSSEFLKVILKIVTLSFYLS